MAPRSRKGRRSRCVPIRKSSKRIWAKGAPWESAGQNATSRRKQGAREMALLELDNVHTYYGNIHALKGISVTVDKGEIVTLIGSNGAGKTTTLKTSSGVLHPREGTITLEGHRIDRAPAHDIVGKGICQAPEGRRIFPRLTTLENL